MSNKIEVEVKLSQEDRKVLDEIYAALRELTGGNCGPHATTGNRQSAPQTDEPEPAKEENQPAEKASESEPQSPEPPAAEAEAAAKQYSREDVQQKVVSLVAAGKKTEVKAIVNEYAERVAAIPEDKLAEVMGRLIALEG